MHQQAATADGFAEAGDLADDIQQEGRSEALAFIDPQPGQQGDGLDTHARHAPGVVDHNSWLIDLGDHKHTRGAGSMGLLGGQ